MRAMPGNSSRVATATAALWVLLVIVSGCASTGDATGDTSPPGTPTESLPGSSATSDPDTSAPEPAGVLDAVFDPVRVRVFDAEGIECAVCMWVADTDTERAQGLMQVEDLEGAFGMAFVYDRPTNSSFWMKDTLLPLSIAYYDADGMFVGAQDMEPCSPGTTCAVYPPPGEFSIAIEVPQGGLDDLRLVPGSRIELGDPCVPDRALTDAWNDGATGQDDGGTSPVDV
jgi:uncharacterized membrane protein (UPF0127 family)